MEAFRDTSLVDNIARVDVETTAAERFIADAEGILARLNNDPRLGPAPFVILQDDDQVVWTSDRYEIILYKDVGDDDVEGYKMEMHGNKLKDALQFAKMAIANVSSGARRRRNRKTKKTSKKSRKATRRSLRA